MTDKEKEILNEITILLENEHSYEKILSSMCTPPNELLKEIAAKYSEINLGDPGLFPESVKLQSEVLEELAKILHAPKTWVGSTTSGGSESNIIGCWAARNWGREKRKILKGNILFPKSAHVSFEKAIDLLNIKSKWINLNNDYTINIEEVKESIDKNTIGLIGIAGTTGTGSCDNIKALSDLALDHQLYLHVDAAHGGMIYPFLDKLGYPSFQFDFSLEGVSSITIDTHKILGSLIPGGNILFRSSAFSQYIEKTISYLADSSTKQVTLTGTRPGNSVIASWILLKKFGEEYILTRVKKCLELTQYIIDSLNNYLEIEMIFKPTLNIIGFKVKNRDSEQIIKELFKSGWKVSTYSDWIRIVVMPHFSKKQVDLFIKDLVNIIQ